MNFVFVNTGTREQNAGVVRCFGLGAQLRRRGHRVALLISGQEKNRVEYGSCFRGIRLVYAPAGSLREEAGKLVELLHMKDADVVHCMGIDTVVFLPAFLAKWVFQRKYRLVLDFEDKQSLLVHRRKQFYRFWEHLGQVSSDVVLTASEALAEDQRAGGNLGARYLPFGLDPERAWSEERYPVNRGEPARLGYLGSFIRAHADQFQFLGRSLPALRAVLGDFVMHFIGDGPLRETVEGRLREACPGQTYFHGFVEEEHLIPLLSSMDVLVFPFPATLFNRFRCPHKAYLYTLTGRPVVTNCFGEVGRLLSEYPRAHYYAQNSTDSFLTAVKAALQDDGAHDLGPFYEKHSWKCVTDRYLAILRGALPASIEPRGTDGPSSGHLL